jgi:signal peptidase II
VKIKSGHLAVLLVLLVLIFDQSLKIWVKTTMLYNDEIRVMGLDWFRLHFTENPGMAFGLELGGSYGKLALSIFRIIAVGFMVYYIRLLIKKGAHKGLVASIALILAGAIGNILDSAFYGLIFSESGFHVPGPAVMFPEDGGYANFLHGKVVDMLYFPLYDGNFWGLLGDRNFQFFRPVFNIADSSITIGVLIIILFQKPFFNSLEDKPKDIDNNAIDIPTDNPVDDAVAAIEEAESENNTSDTSNVTELAEDIIDDVTDESEEIV